MARGKYILFLDSDDFFEPEMLSRLCRSAEDSDADVVVCRADAFYSDSVATTVPLRPLKQLESGVYRTEDIAGHLFQSFTTSAWNKLFRLDMVRSQVLSFQTIPRSSDVLLYESEWGIDSRSSLYGYTYSKLRAFAYNRMRLLSTRGLERASRAAGKPVPRDRIFLEKVAVFMRTVYRKLGKREP